MRHCLGVCERVCVAWLIGSCAQAVVYSSAGREGRTAIFPRSWVARPMTLRSSPNSSPILELFTFFLLSTESLAGDHYPLLLLNYFFFLSENKDKVIVAKTKQKKRYISFVSLFFFCRVGRLTFSSILVRETDRGGSCGMRKVATATPPSICIHVSLPPLLRVGSVGSAR